MSTTEILDQILPEIANEFKKVLSYLESLEHAPTIEEMEAACRVGAHLVSVRLMESLLQNGEKGYVGPSIRCSCGNRIKFHSYRKKIVQTLVGDITYERAYYYCKHCGEGRTPMDDELGVGRREMSKAVERSVCRLCAIESFENASEDLYELSGISVSAKSAQMVSESCGERILHSMRNESKEAVVGDLVIEAEDRPEMVCITMDGKMIPSTSGHHRELKVAAIYDLVDKANGAEGREPGRTTYLGQISEAETFAEMVWVEAARRGAEVAKKVEVLGDGARWIWNQAATHWPNAVQILDYYHADEHIWDLGKVLYEEGTEKTRRFVTYKLDQIWNGNVEKVITALGRLKVSGSKKQEKLYETIDYLEANKHRMNYPLYRSKGYHIGSGVVESAAKQFGARLDQAGMRWTERGAGAIAALRALRLSGYWDRYWQPVRLPLLA